jgi:hypothetical protein
LSLNLILPIYAHEQKDRNTDHRQNSALTMATVSLCERSSSESFVSGNELSEHGADQKSHQAADDSHGQGDELSKQKRCDDSAGQRAEDDLEQLE